MRSLALALLWPLLFLLCAAARAATGLTELPGLQGDGPVTVFYPTAAAEQPLKRGPFTIQAAQNGTPERGNGRLVVISHGSGGSAWVHADLARVLAAAGFVVALPEHAGDNYKDRSGIGPTSWRKRPAEVSRAIDAVGKDARFAPLLKLDRVGMYGMSAGGHTALTLAGGRWAPALLARHCQKNIKQDFPACAGLATRLTGGWSDSFKIWTTLTVINLRFTDPVLVGYSDPRVQAVVAGVPYAADFDMTTLAKPAVPLGLVNVGKDKWLAPRFHGEAVLKACSACITVANLPEGGHGALLSPFPPGLPEAAAELLNDPPGFDRKLLAEVDRVIVEFFRKHL
jgi:predicted dienelactone hydrolase